MFTVETLKYPRFTWLHMLMQSLIGFCGVWMVGIEVSGKCVAIRVIATETWSITSVLALCIAKDV